VCAVNGGITRNFMKSPRRFTPKMPKTCLKNIILGGGEKLLSPERRFDQTVYFTLGQQL